MLRPGQILCIYLHLAPDHEKTNDLIDSGAVARKSTYALNAATFYCAKLSARLGRTNAVRNDALY